MEVGVAATSDSETCALFRINELVGGISLSCDHRKTIARFCKLEHYCVCACFAVISITGAMHFYHKKCNLLGEIAVKCLF